MIKYLFPQKPVRIYPGSMADSVLDNPAWLIENKYDGARAMTYVDSDGTFKVWNRHERVIPEARIPDLYALLRQLSLPPGTILDGEIYPRGVVAGATPAPGVYKYALFDLMQPGTLDERQSRLRQLLAVGSIGNRIHFVEQAVAEKPAFMDRVMTDPVSEGVVFKRRDSLRYDHPRRSVENPVWLKIVKPTLCKA